MESQVTLMIRSLNEVFCKISTCQLNLMVECRSGYGQVMQFLMLCDQECFIVLKQYEECTIYHQYLNGDASLLYLLLQ